ncbi:MAG: hypothetical protein J0I43_03700 [Microbacterium sp.]|uniref:hypothetical protein n=1 Tax=Microbacterium sp. TaxID=51671 RepID=UPI001ACD4171|nr:hypothetical protein [Microbacterium sp.]MBN9176457.1 hypothetical protein [Microbacterium sp.]
MRTPIVEQEVTICLVDEVPSRMYFAGRRWRVSETPTRLRDSVWAFASAPRNGLYGWRFQATDDAGESFVFDVHPSETGWHVHHTYA